VAKIWTVCKDPGGTNGIIPVNEELTKMNHHARLVATGNALERLPLSKIKFYTLEEALEIDLLPDIFITSMCQRGGVGRNLIPLMKASGIPVITVQDIWGGQLIPEWEDSKFRPDYICVNDEINTEAVRRAWPEFKEDKIITTGFPALDRYAGYDISSISERARSGLNIPKNGFVVLYCDQIDFAGDMVLEVIEALNKINNDNVYFIPRMHPRLKKESPEELPKWEKAMTKFSGGTLIKESQEYSTSDIVAASDVVLSMFSTVNIEAATLRKPNICIMYPDMGMALYTKACGKVTDDFPLISLGCSKKVTTRRGLTEALDQSIFGDLGLRHNQEKTFRLDGKNASRVADLVASLV